MKDRELQEALLKKYPSRYKLETMIRQEFGLPVELFGPEECDMRYLARQLVDWVVNNNQKERLIKTLYEKNVQEDLEQWAVSAARHEDEWSIKIVDVPRGVHWSEAFEEAFPDFTKDLNLLGLREEENGRPYPTDLETNRALAPEMGWNFDCVKIPRPHALDELAPKEKPMVSRLTASLIQESSPAILSISTVKDSESGLWGSALFTLDAKERSRLLLSYDPKFESEEKAREAMQEVVDQVKAMEPVFG